MASVSSLTKLNTRHFSEKFLTNTTYHTKMSKNSDLIQYAVSELESRHERALAVMKGSYETYVEAKNVHDKMAKVKAPAPNEKAEAMRVDMLAKSEEIFKDAERNLNDAMKLVEEIAHLKIIAEQYGMSAFQP